MSHLDVLFRRYMELLRQFSETSIEYETALKEKHVVTITQLINHVQKVIAGIQKAADAVYHGCHSAAFIAIRNLIQNDLSTLPLKIFPINSKLYRMRTIKQRNKVGINDLFHIPLNKRGIVKTQRYSAPGIPCLYLGESIYVCWEEMLRPDLSNCFISRFENQKELRLLDLSIPELSEWLETDSDGKYTLDTNDTLVSSLYRLPLLIACMVEVKNIDDVFKPEYMFSQLIMEMITNHLRETLDLRKDEPLFVGVYYTTVHQHEDFGFSISTVNGGFNYHLLNNIAIPVMRPTSPKKFCPMLCDLFLLTEPTCDEFERAKMPYNFNPKWGYISLGNDPYQISTFGQLEKRINSFPLIKISPN